jgi:endogenous inhibitor of DNA gyrase (YacG/DUF329 family)
MQPVRRPIKCPTCGDSVVWSEANRFRPFCSERCKNIDLGAWSSGSYSIPENGPSGSDQGDDLESD